MLSVIWFDENSEIQMMAHINFQLWFGKEDKWDDITNKK